MKLQSRIWIISIAVALSIIFHDSIFHTSEIKFDKSKALEDILTNHVKVLSYGITGPSIEMDLIANKYGFREYNLGCVRFHDEEQEEYQAIIDKYLEWRNGKDWKAKYTEEMNDLFKYRDSINKRKSNSSR